MFSSRRNFIKSSLGLASAGLIAPSLLRSSEAVAQVLGNSVPRAANVGFKVAENGTARAFIAVPDAPSDVVKYAAQELQWHIERATGVKLDVVAEKDAAASPLKNRIYLGPCQAAAKAGIKVDDLAVNSYRKKTTADAVFLVGVDEHAKPDDTATKSYAAAWKQFVIGAPPLDDGVSMGTLFAVYDWLEHQIGVKWLWPGEVGTFVPKSAVLAGGAVGAATVIPTLIHARPRLNAWRGMDRALKPQYIWDNSVWLRRQRFVRGMSFEYRESFLDYWARFGATHPEYFALRPDGIRAPHSLKRVDLVQMCVSNPDLHQQVIADWQVQIKEHPSLPWINGCENDKTAQDPSCTCEVCRSWDPPNAPLLPNQEKRKAAIKDTSDVPMVSLSDRYARFWLALQKEGEKHDLKATVFGLAYADYTQPPVATKLNDRIIIGIVAPNAFPLSAEEEKAFKTLWDGWAKTGAKLFLRPNFFLTGYCMPYIYARQFGEIYKYAASHNMIADDYDSLLAMWGVQSPNYYMMGRLNVDPTLDTQDVMNDYYAGFGPAAKPVEKYFTFWEGVTAKCTTEVRRAMTGGWASISTGGDLVFTPETFVTGHALMEDAKTAAAGDEETARRVAYLDMWLQHADLSMQALAAYHALKKKPADKQLQTAMADAKTAVDEFRAAHATEIVNVGVLRQVEVWAGWRKTAELSA
jgi:hypothetical protein